MHKAKKSLVAAVTVLALTTLFALPASAQVSPGVIVFQGNASILDKDTCTTLTGLQFPGVGPGQEACWDFSSGGTLGPVPPPNVVPANCQAIGLGVNGLVEGCTIGPVVGLLGAVASPLAPQPPPLDLVTPVGGWCGLSRGYSGSGAAATLSGSQAVAVDGVGWHVSAGSILPIHGHWKHTGPGGGSTANGTLAGAVQAFGGANCAAGGASNFEVLGVIALL